jgi:protein gp37
MKNPDSAKNRKKSQPPRFRVKEHYPPLSLEEVAAIDRIDDVLDEMVRQVKKEYKLSTVDLAELLDPVINSSSSVSKITAKSMSDDPRWKLKDKRHCTKRQMAALFYVFGASIDDALRKVREPREVFKRPDNSAGDGNR